MTDKNDIKRPDSPGRFVMLSCLVVGGVMFVACLLAAAKNGWGGDLLMILATLPLLTALGVGVGWLMQKLEAWQPVKASDRPLPPMPSQETPPNLCWYCGCAKPSKNARYGYYGPEPGDIEITFYRRVAGTPGKTVYLISEKPAENLAGGVWFDHARLWIVRCRACAWKSLTYKLLLPALLVGCFASAWLLDALNPHPSDGVAAVGGIGTILVFLGIAVGSWFALKLRFIPLMPEYRALRANGYSPGMCPPEVYFAWKGRRDYWRKYG